MSDILIEGIVKFFIICLIAITIQNSVFARALSISRLISLVDDTTSTATFGFQLILVSVIGGTLNYYANRALIKFVSNPSLFRPLVIILCMSAAYLLVFVIIVKMAPLEKMAKTVDTLPLATFNCTVIGTLMLTTSSQFGLFDTICYSIGTGIGYLFAVMLATEGQRKIQTSNTPIAFRGLPVTLLYLAGLSLAIYGLTGYSFEF
ncbi:MAG: Rnf-Nqr domain containing protein [Oscillospiraceae bacterium]